MKVTPNRLTFFATTLVLALQCALPADAATVVFNNLAASPPYYLNGGGIIGTSGTQSFITGTSFTPNATGQLDELTLGLFYVQGTNSVTLRLSPDVGGVPGAPIWQGSGTPAPAYLQLMTMTGIARTNNQFRPAILDRGPRSPPRPRCTPGTKIIRATWGPSSQATCSIRTSCVMPCGLESCLCPNRPRACCY